MGIGNLDDNEAILEILDIIKHSLKNSNILEAIQSIDSILKTYEKKELVVKAMKLLEKRMNIREITYLTMTRTESNI